MDSEIKRTHFDLSIVTDSVVRSGPRVSRPDVAGWGAGASRSSSWVCGAGIDCPRGIEAVRRLLLGFGASAGAGRCQVAGAQGYSRGSQKMLLLPPFPSEDREVVSFSSVPREASLAAASR